MINLQEITVILNAQNLCVTFLKQEMRKKGLLFHTFITTQLFCWKNWYPYLLGLFQNKRRWKVVILDQTSALEYPEKRDLAFIWKRFYYEVLLFFEKEKKRLLSVFREKVFTRQDTEVAKKKRKSEIPLRKHSKLV